LRIVKDSITVHQPDRAGYGATPDQIHQIPYATMGVQLGDELRFVTVLANADDGRLTWAAGDEKLFVTERGRLVGTSGLDRDLTATRWLRPDPLRDPGRLSDISKPTVYREVDLRIEGTVETGLPVESTFRMVGAETITVLGKKRQTFKVRELARIRKWRWEARNVFWLEQQIPLVWRSFQSYCPEVRELELEILKRPNVG